MIYSIWYDMIWYDMIWYDMIWYDMIWYDLLYEYGDLRVVFGWNKTRISLHTIFFTCEKSRMSVLIGCTTFFTCEKSRMSVLIGWHFLTQKLNACSQANVNMESDFVNLLRREIYNILSAKNLERSWRNTFVVSLTWNKPHGCVFCTKTNR